MVVCDWVPFDLLTALVLCGAEKPSRAARPVCAASQRTHCTHL